MICMQRPRFPRKVFVLLAMLLTMFATMHHGEILAADFTIQPSIAISEEYSDNINQEPEKRSAFTTRVKPGVAAWYRAPLWDWRLNYGFEYRYYTEEKRAADGGMDSHDYRHDLSAKGLVRIIDDLFYLEISDVYSRTDLNVVRTSGDPQFNDDPQSEVDQDGSDMDSLAQEIAGDDVRESDSSDRNIFTVSPYFAFQPTARTDLRTGYQYSNTWYKEDIAKNSQSHKIFADGSYQLTYKLALTSGYSMVAEYYEGHDDRDDQGDQGDQDREYRQNVYVGTRYVFSPSTRAFGRVGSTWRDRTGRENTNDLFWSAGLSQTMGRYVANLSTTVRYVDDPLRDATRKETVFGAGLAREYGRGVVNLSASYSEFEEPKETKYATGLTVGHALTQRLSANTGLVGQRRKNQHQIRIDEWSTFFGLRYLLTRDLTASLRYQYRDSSSQDPLSRDNFQENRVVLELRLFF